MLALHIVNCGLLCYNTYINNKKITNNIKGGMIHVCIEDERL